MAIPVNIIKTNLPQKILCLIISPINGMCPVSLCNNCMYVCVYHCILLQKYMHCRCTVFDINTYIRTYEHCSITTYVHILLLMCTYIH